MRASNEFVAGEWSEASVVSIPEPPRPSVMTEIEVKDFKVNIMESRKRALATEVIVNAVWSPPNVTNGNLTGYDAHIGLQPLESRDNPEDLKLTQFEVMFPSHIHVHTTVSIVAGMCLLLYVSLHIYEAAKSRVDGAN